MIDTKLFLTTVILLTVSVIMSYSLAAYAVVHFHYSEFHFVIRQAAAVGVGMVIILILSKFDPDKWFTRFGFLLFFFSFAAIIAMQVMPSSMVNTAGGATRWLQIGPISIAPVEFFKVGFVFFLSWSFARKLRDRGKMSLYEEFMLFLPYAFLFGFAVILIAIFQKDLGQVVVLAGTLSILFVFAGRSMKFFMVLMSLGFMAFVALIMMSEHRIKRIMSWWTTVQDSILSFLPFESIKSLHVEAVKEPYQISNSLNAIHNGGIWGQGLGNGQFKLGYVSEVHTDFVFAGIAEELGFIGVGIVIALFMVLIFRLNKIAGDLLEPHYYLFSVGVALLISLSLVINTFGISGITPIKGIAVPFLSYGGSQIVANSIAIGMVLMISKKMGRWSKPKKEKK